jgi:Restriction endonuclease BamHI
LKIINVVTLQDCGVYAASKHWKNTRRQIHKAVRRCEWPIGTGRFTIYPQSGKKSGEGNGVKPIRNEFVRFLKTKGWAIEGNAKNALGQALGDFDAVLAGPEKPIVVEWETGNISSSHRSMNKLTMLVACGIISAGVLVVPSRRLYAYLTDRIGNIKELEPYFGLWKSVPCTSGVLEIIVIEQDAESFDVPKIPKATDGRAKR